MCHRRRPDWLTLGAAAALAVDATVLPFPGEPSVAGFSAGVAGTGAFFCFAPCATLRLLASAKAFSSSVKLDSCMYHVNTCSSGGALGAFIGVQASCQQAESDRNDFANKLFSN